MLPNATQLNKKCQTFIRRTTNFGTETTDKKKPTHKSRQTWFKYPVGERKTSITWGCDKGTNQVDLLPESKRQ